MTRRSIIYLQVYIQSMFCLEKRRKIHEFRKSYLPWYWLAMLVGATGVWHRILVRLTFTTVHGWPPTLTTTGYWTLLQKFSPLIVSVVPPCVLPVFGETLEMTKKRANIYVIEWRFGRTIQQTDPHSFEMCTNRRLQTLGTSSDWRMNDHIDQWQVCSHWIYLYTHSYLFLTRCDNRIHTDFVSLKATYEIGTCYTRVANKRFRKYMMTQSSIELTYCLLSDWLCCKDDLPGKF